MRTHHTIILALLLASGCPEQGRENHFKARQSSVVGETDPEVLKVSKRSLEIENAVAILESDYLAQLAAGDFGAGDEKDRSAVRHCRQGKLTERTRRARNARGEHFSQRQANRRCAQFKEERGRQISGDIV